MNIQSTVVYCSQYQDCELNFSCGGNMLMNVGPTKYGMITPVYQERLVDMGQWLQVNGEGIYASHPWQYQNDTANPDVW